MGRITIEIPQGIKRNYRIVSVDVAERILKELEQNIPADSLKDQASDEILGMWADREESPDEIASKLRQGWNRMHKNDSISD